ncbi:MAG: DUF1622 domain-containing protein [Cyanobacteria bacterium P01_G01_bin.38]
MELIEHLEARLAIFVGFLTLGLESIAAFCVLIGLVKTGQLAIALNRHHFRLNRRHARKFSLALLRLRFGVWLAVALEFQLGADVVATTVAPSFEALGKLGAIAAIRTFLNHFLNQELAEELAVQRKIDHETSVKELTGDEKGIQ